MLKHLILDRGNKINTSTTKGFTLIEVIVVLIILGIIFAYIFFGTTNNNNLQTEADMFKSHLRHAQYIALCGDNTYTWRITAVAGANSYSFSRMAGAASVAFPLPGEALNTHTFAAGVTITATSAVGGIINFDQWGSPGGNTITINLSQGGVTKNITITKNTGFIQ
jgi:MSHA pilin protein MshC